MESYIVRIYRREEGNPQNLVGTVEHLGAEGPEVFHTPQDLIAILRESQENADDQRS